MNAELPNGALEARFNHDTVNNIHIMASAVVKDHENNLDALYGRTVSSIRDLAKVLESEYLKGMNEVRSCAGTVEAQRLEVLKAQASLDAREEQLRQDRRSLTNRESAVEGIRKESALRLSRVRTLEKSLEEAQKSIAFLTDENAAFRKTYSALNPFETPPAIRESWERPPLAPSLIPYGDSIPKGAQL